MSWWKRATEEQRLAQIDGGIECGMTIRQIAMNCGATTNAVGAYGRSHGRTFTGVASMKNAVDGGKVARIMKARNAGAPNTAMRDAFSIFDDHRTTRSLFDLHPHDEDAA